MLSLWNIMLLLFFATQPHAIFILFNEDLVRNWINTNMKIILLLLFLGYSIRRR